MARLAQLVCHRDTTSTTSDDDVVPCLVRRDGLARRGGCRGRDATCRGGIASWSSPGASRGRRRGLRRQLRIIRVLSRSGVRKRRSVLAKQATVVRDRDIVGAARVAGRLVGGCSAQDGGPGARRDAALCAVLAPDEAVLAPVDDLERRGVDCRRERREGCVAVVLCRLGVSCGVAEGAEDLVFVRPCHQKQRLGHLAGLAMGDTAVCCARSRWGCAALEAG